MTLNSRCQDDSVPMGADVLMLSTACELEMSQPVRGGAEARPEAPEAHRYVLLSFVDGSSVELPDGGSLSDSLRAIADAMMCNPSI